MTKRGQRSISRFHGVTALIACRVIAVAYRYDEQCLEVDGGVDNIDAEFQISARVSVNRPSSLWRRWIVLVVIASAGLFCLSFLGLHQ